MIDFATPFHLFLALCIAHVLADFPLQGEFLSQAKNRFTDIGFALWRWCLPAHAAIHAGFVWALTGSLWLGVAEFICHGFIDWLKCNQDISFTQDQIAHYACKGIWVWTWFLWFQ